MVHTEEDFYTIKSHINITFYLETCDKFQHQVDKIHMIKGEDAIPEHIMKERAKQQAQSQNCRAKHRVNRLARGVNQTKARNKYT